MTRPFLVIGTPKKLNLGCGEYTLPGYINVGIQPPADVVGDFTKDFTFSDVEEVRMSHVLEHIPWVRTIDTLKLIHSWMKPGAEIIVEVPDMYAIAEYIIEQNSFDEYAQLGTYGIQSNMGEYHMAGFSRGTLRVALAEAGFVNKTSRCFVSDHDARPGFPCVEAVAEA